MKTLIALFFAASAFAQIPVPSPGQSGGVADNCSASVTSIPSGIHCISMTLSSAQLLSGSIQLFAAPGAHHVVLHNKPIYEFFPGATPYYTGGGACTFTGKFGSGSGPTTEGYNITGLGFLDQTSTVFASTATPGALLNGVYDASLVVNQPVLLVLQGQGCNSGPLVSSSLNAAGTGYVVGDLETIQSGSLDAVLRVASLGAAGAVATYTVTNAGTGVEQPGGPFATANVGNVTSATVTAMHAGLLYANGDNGTISGCGDGTATYHVLTSTAGAVGTVSVTGGAGYTTTAACTTTISSGMGDGNLQLDVVAGGGSGFTVNVASVAHGDGSVLAVYNYQILTVQ